MRKILDNGLRSIIDYAGYFPPAQLPLDKALEEFLHFDNVKGHLCSKFVVPVHELNSLSRLLENRNLGSPVALSIIGAGGESIEHWEQKLEHDAQLLTKFEKECQNAEILAYETRVPSSNHLEQCVHDLQGFEEIELFLEIPWREAHREQGFIEAIETAADLQDKYDFALKARTGGVHHSAYPELENLAEWIHRSAQLEVPYKFTAGMHEPISHFFGSENSTLAYGFMNVLFAVALCLKEDLLVDELRPIIGDCDQESFHFNGDIWKYHRFELNSDDLADARTLFVSFGSCSIDEPLAGLRQFGLEF